MHGETNSPSLEVIQLIGTKPAGSKINSLETVEKPMVQVEVMELLTYVLIRSQQGDTAEQTFSQKGIIGRSACRDRQQCHSNHRQTCF